MDSPGAPDNHPMVDATAPLAGHPAVKCPPAFGHDDALVLQAVEGQGRLCGPCWRLWMRRALTWPALFVMHEVTP